MVKKTIELTYVIEVEYNPQSVAFQDAFSSYMELIDDSASEEEFVHNVAFQAHRQGYRRMIEGAGYVKCRGLIEKPDMYCGIDIDDDDPMPDIETL